MEEQILLEASVIRLRAMVEPLDPEQLQGQAYPSEWTVADVLSHIGSGAVVFARWIDQGLGGEEVVPQPIWDEWNAKGPGSKAADCLRADQALVERIGALTKEERARFAFSMGPMSFDLAGFLRLRINEHVLHSWDIAVVLDAAAVLAPDAVPTVLQALPMMSRFAGKPTGSTRELRVRTTAPDRLFVVALSADGVSVTPAATETGGEADLELPAEALIRLAYGRLDPGHTGAFEGNEADLDELRRAFPGV